MQPDLPKTPSLEDIQKSNKKQGRFKTIVDQFQTNIIVILLLMASFVYSQKNLDKRFSELRIENTIDNSSQTSSDSKNTNVFTPGNNNNIQLGDQDEQGKTKGDNVNTFNPDDWIIESFEQDKEGYYCPLTKKFEFWSIWSKKKLPPDFDQVRIKIRIKHKNNSTKPPTFAISYGEYKPSFSPVQYYRINIFDTDTQSVRLYDNKNNSVAQGYLKEHPDMSSDLLITLSPRIPDPKSRRIKLNPTITYAVSNQEEPGEFSPEEEFSTLLPTVVLEDGTPQQIGLGVNYDVCFKPISIEL